MTHLWEIDHPYYAADGTEQEEPSFAALKATVDASDEDMNFVYRWDWKGPHSRYADETDPEKFAVHMILPRKSRFWTVTCPIAKHQEFEVLEWLSGPRCLGYLKTMWAPVMDSLPAGAPSDREAAIWGHHVTALEEIQRSVAEQLDATRARAAAPSTPEGDHTP